MGDPRALAELRHTLRADPKERLIFALDVATLAEARALVEQLHGEVGVFKIGLELFTAAGPAALTLAHERGRKTFLDLKLHDIPATVERAVAAAVRLGASYLTVHAAAGPQALQAAARAAAGSSLRLLAVTMLTSADNSLLDAIGLEGPVSSAVVRLAQVAVENGVHGLICAPSDCEALRMELGDDVLLVTPGVRQAGAERQDQKRVGTPSSALAAGADLLVVGRPIRDAQEPQLAARAIVQEISQAQ
jgi:orotidine-5'-phosphate decarboxylase